ncbi:MAG: alpha/beta hydrolase [Chitinophagaceae bacterium]|nr:alpha/beta hydrolase [Chitinophagaceae bacterium]
MQEKCFLFQNKNICYNVSGSGQPVILLHGFGEDGMVWQSQIEFLQNNFKLVMPDIPGSGQSEFVPNATIETYAEVIKELIEIEIQKEKGEVVLIGHSMGGYVTLAFAEKYPRYLKSFGLFHSSAFADPEEKISTRKKAINFIKENGAFNFLKTSTPGLFTQRYKDQHPEKVEALIEAGKQFSPEALIQYYEAMIARPDRTHVLTSFNKPVLFLIGEHDQAIPFESSMRQCYLPAQSHVNILRESAHMGMWEETEKSNTILLDFLSVQ